MTQLNTDRQMTYPSSKGSLMSLTYRSRASVPWSENDLHQIERVADSRNRSENISGVIVYDDGNFFQWLEGPTESLTRVWDSVQRDSRHADIRVSSAGPTRSRVFGDFGMKLLQRGDPLWSAAALTGPTVPHLVETVVVPTLVARRGGQRQDLPQVDPRAAEFANLLIGTNPGAASALARELSDRAGSLAFARATLFDPAARSLGDLWYQDDCSALELDLGLLRMQAIVRELGSVANLTGLGKPAILVAPQPGESHLLGAALDTELLWQAGWDAHAEFPATDDALQKLLAGQWFEALDLSLSSALRREDWRVRVAHTVATARVASRNPALVVVVGGRSFAAGEGASDAASVGADVNGSQVLQLGASIESVLRRPRSTERRKESVKSAAKREAKERAPRQLS